MNSLVAQLLSAAALGADPAPGATTAPPPQMSVWDFALKGGPTMAVIAVCSLVALAVIVERLILTRRAAVVPPAFLANLKAAGPDRALEVARADASPIGRILAAAVSHRSATGSLEDVRGAIAETGQRELVRLRHRMRLLGALPQVATMLGLLGTILGMIKTFQAIAVSGQSLGKTELLARGIFEAWANTAAGLLVAIPVLIAYQILQGRIDARVADLDRAASEWLEDLRAPQPSVRTPKSASPPAPVEVTDSPATVLAAASA